MGYGELQSTACVPSQTTFTQQLIDRKKHHEAQLNDINAALDALTKNPDLQNLVDVISKVRY